MGFPAGERAQRTMLGEEIFARLQRAAQEILARYDGIVAAYLYGSAARREAAADLDIGLVLARPCTDPFWLIQVRAELEEAGRPLPLEIDLRCLNGGGPRFLMEVVRDGRLLYERDRAARLRFLAGAMSQWLDFRPCWERLRRVLLEDWRNG
ncbi:MAG: nucleotidyltransferase domain-containing protein [Deltaproteobacteria bacterium]|nr:nucleotidyltransferase domain-containing protein [Deltaproteobacteria bacterium]